MIYACLKKGQGVFMAGLFILLFINGPVLCADENTPSPAATALPPAPTTPDSQDPVPYTVDEFPGWALKLRRAEIIAVGTIPITFIVTYLAYDLIRLGIHQGAADYNPFVSNHKPYEGWEDAGVAITACSLSICIAVIDYWIGEVQAKKEKKRKEQSLNASNR